MQATPLPFTLSNKKSSIWHSLACLVLLVAPTIAYAVPVAQQMELRESEEYYEENFKKSKPAVGSLAPNLKLKTLDGKTASLDSYRGKNIVVIKAGYT